MRRLAAALAARQTPDFEAWESLVLQAARQGGAGVLGTLLRHWQQHTPREVILCKCGRCMSSRGRRSKRLLTTLGRVPFARSFYKCPPCSQGRFPDDERLDIVQTTYSPGVRRLMARAGSQSQFQQAAADLRCYAGLRVEAREIERPPSRAVALGATATDLASGRHTGAHGCLRGQVLYPLRRHRCSGAQKRGARVR